MGQGQSLGPNSPPRWLPRQPRPCPCRALPPSRAPGLGVLQRLHSPRNAKLTFPQLHPQAKGESTQGIQQKGTRR